MFYWFRDFLPSPELLQFAGWSIYWYGFLIVLAMASCLLVISYLARINNLDKTKILDLFFYLVIFGVLGARLYYVFFYNLDYYLGHPLDILKIWQGGLAIHGGVAAGLLTGYFFIKKNNLVLAKYLDILAVALPLGQAIGRWGNYFNQELFGKPCQLPWCIAIDLDHRPAVYQSFQYFHPVFLYESLLNLGLFCLLFWGYKIKKWRPGSAIIIYLIGYSVIRFLTEFLRIDVIQTHWGLKWVQWLCLLVIGVCCFYFFFFWRKKSGQL